MAALELLDTTLREGEQCCGVFFSLETKVRLAGLLDEAGVDFIEAGHPAAAPSLRQASAAIALLDLRAQLIAHARMDRDEIRLVRDLGFRWVGLFSGVNAISLERYGLSRKAAFERISRSVGYAKEIGLSVRFTCEDASRTGATDLAELYGRLRELGVDRMSYADTVGTDTPERLEQLCRRLGGTVPFEALHFHFHDDRGMAFANAVKAIELGAQCIDTSVLGLGERMGLVRLEDMVRRQERGSFPVDGSIRRDAALAAAEELVASSIDPGRFCLRRFAHKSGIHIHGVLRDPRHYEHAEPALTGGRRLIVLSKLIGRSGLRMLLSAHGFETDDAGLERLLRRIKAEDRLELTGPKEIIRYFEGCPECRRMICAGAP
jgi:isopropylmalate/homocitrate/citramalate synthase